ncbi:MAG: hypothetical protein HYZ25_17195 [Chloroflexi bacterium]|nr:hypothetical protein [Chloroflexota bacterium]
MSTLKRFALFMFVLTLTLAVTGCGPSAEETYFTNLAPAVEDYNTAINEVGTQFDSINNDALNDQAWMDATFAALDHMESAAQTMAATPTDQVPEKWTDLNNLLVQISDQTSLFVSDMKSALESQDKDAMMAALDEFAAIGPLFEQVQAELNQ